MTDSETNAPITFSTRLTDDDWDATLKAWRCSALAIPKAEICALFVDGKRADKDDYQVMEHAPTMVRWLPMNPPSRIVAQLRLGERLSLESETSRWKKFAIVLPVVGTVLAAVIGAIGVYIANTGRAETTQTDLVTARLSEWSIDPKERTISYKLLAEPLNLNLFIKRPDKTQYQLVIGVRPRSALSNTEGRYDYVYGPYPFDSSNTKIAKVDDKLADLIDKQCVDLALFRVSNSGLARIPFAAPFIPVNYGADLQVLASNFDGACP